MLLGVVLALTTAIVIAMVVLPLVKSARAAPERSAFDRAVYRDQLRELERDAARGLIDEKDMATARLEIERRLLATESRRDTSPMRVAGSRALAVALAFLITGTAAGLYLALGAPGVPDQPYASRKQERALATADGHADLEKTVAALEEKLKADPNRAEDWFLLARTEATLNHWQRSDEAYQRALHLTKDRPDIAASYGEMLVMAAEGIVTPRAHEALTGVLARDPKNVVARYYLALGDAQAGEAQKAIDAWQKLAADMPANSDLRTELKTRIAETASAAGLKVPELAAPAPGPSAEDMAKAAAMTPEQRREMITSMVEGLAAKLRDNPNDPEGWTKLGRAYSVLGERDKAADAYEHAATLKPDDINILLAEAEVLITDRSPETPVPQRAVAVLKRIDALDPKQPASLWYLGLAAAQQRRFDEASTYWQRLLAQLPPESDAHTAVAHMIDALKEKK